MIFSPLPLGYGSAPAGSHVKNGEGGVLRDGVGLHDVGPHAHPPYYTTYRHN